MKSSLIALSAGDIANLMNSRRIDAVTAACRTSGLSSFEYDRSCRCRMNAVFESWSNLGSGLVANLKACATQSNVARMDSAFG